MTAITLNKSIFRLVVGTVLFTTLGVLVSMWATTSSHAQKQLNRNLNVAQGVLQQVLTSRAQQLFISANALTLDFPFRTAVATQDRSTIQSVLQNHGDRINADLVALISLEGQLISSTSNAISKDHPFPYPEFVKTAIQDGGNTSLMMFDGKLYQTIILTVDAPRPIALTLVGFELDEQLLDQLKTITQLEITLQVTQDDKLLFSKTTLDSSITINYLQENHESVNWFENVLFNRQAFISKRFPLAKLENQTVWVVLSEDVEQVFSEFNQLQLTISIVALLSILITLIFGALFSHRLSTPLRHLAEVAKRISNGNYQHVEAQDKYSLLEVQKLSSAFSIMQDNIQLRESKIIFQANHDLLTQVNNRYYIEKCLDEKLQLKQEFQAIGINIFGFRGINDIFGYQNGDICLKILATRVAKLGGLAARLTGGELLWIPDSPKTEQQLIVVKHELEQPINTERVIINLKVAMGIIGCPTDAQNAQLLFRRMNIVLDEAQITRQLLLYFDPAIEQRYLRRLSIIVELKKALTSEQQELSLAYQPKLSIGENKIDNVEALIRWNSATLGFVSPEDFIRIAEQAGFIEKVTEWVINRAIADALVLKQAGIELCIAINLSAKDVMNENLLSYVVAQLEQHHLPKSALSFEVTESDLVKEPEKAIKHLSAFKAQGFLLAIDDFGTGYSSLAYLKNLPVDILKVDKGFILKLDTQVGDQHIVKTVIDLAKSFGMGVVAEGVENEMTLNMLRQWQCEYAQGYFICKPIPVNALIKWYQDNINKNWLEMS